MTKLNGLAQALGRILFAAVDEPQVLNIIRDPFLDKIVPGMAKLAGCAQGTKTTARATWPSTASTRLL
jgi:hypothetical protein